ncbi:MAG TPA: hypothetical protein VM182_00370 [Terriglobia bacterium]|nr:hypothetical protein [Terriglobia bacterium]
MLFCRRPDHGRLSPGLLAQLSQPSTQLFGCETTTRAVSSSQAKTPLLQKSRQSWSAMQVS